MKAYFFTNTYLSSIQHGIQSLHCLQELNNKYLNENRFMNEWATEQKTAVILNGGCSDSMNSIAKLMTHQENVFPWASFNEPSLGNILTCVGVIVPEYIWGRVRYDIGTFEYELSMLVRLSHTAK